MRRHLPWTILGFEIEWGFVFQTIGWIPVIALLCVIAHYASVSARNEQDTGRAVIAQTVESKQELDQLTQSVFLLRTQHNADTERLKQLRRQVAALAEVWHVKLPEAKQ